MSVFASLARKRDAMGWNKGGRARTHACYRERVQAARLYSSLLLPLLRLSVLMGNYIFSLTPTFTQGLILGQLSILLLLYFILKYLFFDSKSVSDSLDDNSFHHTTTFVPEKSLPSSLLHPKLSTLDTERPDKTVESAEWLNVLLQQVCVSCTCKLLTGGTYKDIRSPTSIDPSWELGIMGWRDNRLRYSGYRSLRMRWGLRLCWYVVYFLWFWSLSTSWAGSYQSEVH
jgi:hypothetical protein